MTVSVLLDTSFLISLVDNKRDNHEVAKKYYTYILEMEIPIYFSSIVASEFAIKQPITDLPLDNFRTLPFNLLHSIKAAEVWNLLGGRDNGDSRSVIKDDMKIIAQALKENIEFVLTDDTKTFYKYCERLRTVNHWSIKAIKLVDGFDSGSLRLDGQSDIESFT
jgi:PIN domain nuclease of toxin-antitoxin system